MSGLMSSELIPMRWPSQWQNPSALQRLSNTHINCLLIENSDSLRPVVEQAQSKGIRVIHGTSELPGVTVLQGELPGIRMSRTGGQNTASSGPTGLPWVNSNGWEIRLMAALNPKSTIWVDVTPKNPSEPYQLCVADIASCGGNWIISLDDQLAAGIEHGDDQAMKTWKSLIESVEFFSAHNYRSSYVGSAVVGVLSSFSGEDKAMSWEVVKLLTRTTEQYRIIPSGSFSANSLTGLQAVLYPDADPPGGEIRKQLLDFVQAGGLLITRSVWNGIPGTPANWENPRYDGLVFGKGTIAVAKSKDTVDPYMVANDAVVLVSHRFDLVRFWNAGSVSAYLSDASDGKGAVVQMVFYARELNGRTSLGGPENATVRVVGRYKTAQLFTFDEQPLTLGEPDEHGVGMVIDADSVELHLPPLSCYAAVELSA